MRAATEFETCDTEPAMPSVRPPPSSGRYSWVDPARFETVPAAASADEAELARRFPTVGRGTMPVVRVPKF